MENLSKEKVDLLRHNARSVVRELGLLNDAYFEIGEHGCAVNLTMLGENAVLEIVGRQDSLIVGILDNIHQALLLPELEIFMFSQVAVGLVCLRLQPFDIING